MTKKLMILSTALMSFQASGAVLLEDIQFNDPAGTVLSGMANSAGTLAFNNASNATGNGSALAVTQGADATDNIFRSSALTTTGVTTGIFELSFSISSASIAGGDATGANIGFDIRDSGGTELFALRLHRTNSELRLQSRISGTSTNLVDFNATSVSNLVVTAVFDLTTDMMDVSWDEGTVGAGSATNIAINDATMDNMRFFANTNTTDWGINDTAELDSVTLCAVPEPSSLLLLSLSSLGLLARRR